MAVRQRSSRARPPRCAPRPRIDHREHAATPFPAAGLEWGLLGGPTWPAARTGTRELRMTARWPAWVVALALAAPLVAFTAWIAYGLVAPKATQGTPAPAATAAFAALPPDSDLPAERLEERVDGGAEALRAD